ncbi:hypothetical protein ACFXA3_06055 [Streptomyces sp. NPDC059456]
MSSPGHRWDTPPARAATGLRTTTMTPEPRCAGGEANEEMQ